MPATFERTVCPVGRGEFREKARSMQVRLGETALVAAVKEFSTGSLGFYASQKVPVLVGGVEVVAQVQVTVTLVGSKDLPKE
jgi:hypothetical protein